VLAFVVIDCFGESGSVKISCISFDNEELSWLDEPCTPQIWLELHRLINCLCNYMISLFFMAFVRSCMSQCSFVGPNAIRTEKVGYDRSASQSTRCGHMVFLT